jgi:hypothetical protein
MRGGSTAERRRWWIGLALLAIAACQGPADPPPDDVAAFPPASLSALRFKAVLVAGDDAQPVFDNATRYLHDRLIAAGLADEDIHRLSAAARRDHGAEAATLAGVTARIAGLDAAAGEGCLVFLSSHGSLRAGFFLARSRDYLTPALLDRALSAGCAGVPTVVVVSSCFSGNFAAPPMTRSNRIIVTAARRDRPSFGCGVGQTYSVFDQCFLGSLDGAASWPAIFARVRGCVATRESALQETPSEPQGFFAAALAGMPAPWRVATGGDDRAIRFVAGPARFSPDAVPLPPRERRRSAASLKEYSEAAGPKAFALSPDGAFAWYGRNADGPHTAADAERMALEACEWYAGACVLYAVDDAVVAPLPSGLAPFHPPILVRSGRLDAATVPFIRDDQRASIAAYRARPSPKALALGVEAPVVEYASAATMAEARTEALRRCRTAARDCVVSAEDDIVVLGYDTR